MPGHSTGAPQLSRHHKPPPPPHNSSSSAAYRAADGYRSGRAISRDSTASQDSALYKDKDGHHGDHHPPRHGGSGEGHGRRGGSGTAPHRQANGRGGGSETLGFIPGSADSPGHGVRHACGSCASMGWSGCKALLCCVLTCGFYGSREPCLPVNESSTDHAPGKAAADPEPRPPAVAAGNANGLSLSNPTCGVTLDPPAGNNKASKPSKLPASDSFRYPDVRIAGQTVVYPSHTTAPKRSRAGGRPATDSQRPISNTSLYSREDLDLDDLSDAGTDIDSLITKKLLELYALHQIDQLAKCTSDSSFSRKTNEISELIYSIAQDYNLEEQEAECRLVHGVIRISTRKGKRSKNPPPQTQTTDAAPPPPPHHRAAPNGRGDGTLLPDSGNETMHTYTFSSSEVEPEVKVSELTPSDELARKMRNYSRRTPYSSSGSAVTFSPYQHDTETDSSGAPLLYVL